MSGDSPSPSIPNMCNPKSVTDVPSDVVFTILSFLRHPWNDVDDSSRLQDQAPSSRATVNRRTVHTCLLVNKVFHSHASRILYAHVVFAPKFSNTIDLKDRDGLSKAGQLIAATNNSYYASCVQHLTISGHVSPRPPSTSKLHALLLTSLSRFVNLTSVTFIPIAAHDDIFVQPLEHILLLQQQRSDAHHTGLRKLEINRFCCSEANATTLSQIVGLEVLKITSPTRAVLDRMSPWLDKLTSQYKGRLTELHFAGNCGSITPGVLKSFIPRLSSVTSFSLGLSFSLTDSDLFTFLDQVPQLQELRLLNYPQFKLPPTIPFLPHLCSLTVDQHTIAQTVEESNRINKWIRALCSGSSSLRKLRIRCLRLEPDPDGEQSTQREHRPVEYALLASSLIEHISFRHTRTLRVLDLSHAFVSLDHLAQLVACCDAAGAGLEKVRVITGKKILERKTFSAVFASTRYLRTLSLGIAHVRHRRGQPLITNEDARALFGAGPESLRVLKVGQAMWQRLWRMESDGGPEHGGHDSGQAVEGLSVPERWRSAV